MEPAFVTFAAAAAAAGSCNNGTVQLETCCELQDASQLQSYFSITVVVLYFDWQYGCMHVQAELNIAELELTFSLACSNPPQADLITAATWTGQLDRHKPRNSKIWKCSTDSWKEEDQVIWIRNADLKTMKDHGGRCLVLPSRLRQHSRLLHLLLLHQTQESGEQTDRHKNSKCRIYLGRAFAPFWFILTPLIEVALRSNPFLAPFLLKKKNIVLPPLVQFFY